MEIIQLDGFDELENFNIEWNQVLFKSLDNNPFLTQEWLSTWWKHFGNGRRLRLIIIRKEGKISLIAPVMYSTCRLFGAKLRKAEFVATSASDYNAFLFTDFQEATEAVKPLMESIVANPADAECIELKEVPEDSYTAKLLEKVRIDGFKADRVVINECPYVALSNNLEGFLQSLGPNMRRNLKRWEKQALRDYKVKLVSYDRFGTVEEAMKIFFGLHQKRWESLNKNGLFSDSSNRNFHIDLAKAFSENGWLALFFLTFNDEPVSATYCYEYNGKLYAYLTGFDPEYARYRPGYLAFKGLINYGMEKRLKEFDFLRGMEEYKIRLKAKIRRNFEFRVLKKGFKSSFYNWATNSTLFNSLSSWSQIHPALMRISQAITSL
jgi:CelD/BcsL family acetyltransferase involved in cellulose biosynthesis